MKELEGEVVSLLSELGDVDYVLGLSGHTITPENFLGIEINPNISIHESAVIISAESEPTATTFTLSFP